MTIRSILTTYVDNGGGDSATRMAIQMAQKYDAHLTAAVWQPPNPLRARAGRMMTREIDEVLDRARAEFVRERRDAFMERAAAAGVQDRAAFLDLTARRGQSISEVARGHDVVVMGGGPDVGEGDRFGVRPDVVALRSGRPVLLVQPGYAAERIVETAVVAWDGKRAAARALGDAMHILGTKERVMLLAIGEGQAPAHLDATLRLLSLHGIDAQAELHPEGPGGIGQTILDACARQQAGLLVMGAYEHSKFSEDLLGGVTRHILENANLPVLMSH
ncbi:universal stress protein [Paracoccus sp. Z118]|uniref:universal stress protein n=1 Tax=Paracoccus sp. Z118 TaxID=2851017 RepID=UPI001C2C586A|nr:universal stress protein [Paracoccus sp. Z118]MBV0891173.1 universal stress protein [Paracoccus sp. Z118]